MAALPYKHGLSKGLKSGNSSPRPVNHNKKGGSHILKTVSGRNRLTNYDQLNRMFPLWRTQVEHDPDKEEVAFQEQVVHSEMSR